MLTAEEAIQQGDIWIRDSHTGPTRIIRARAIRQNDGADALLVGPNERPGDIRAVIDAYCYPNEKAGVEHALQDARLDVYTWNKRLAEIERGEMEKH